MAIPALRTSKAVFDPGVFLGRAADWPDFARPPWSGELCFITSPRAVDRHLRVILPRLADLAASRGSVHGYRQ
jgi:hypothetical protein